MEAVRILDKWFTSGTFPDHMLDDVRAERALVAELVYGTIRWYRALEVLQKQFVRRRPQAKLELCIRIGLYQLLFMDNMAEHAVINETVETAKTLLGTKAAGMVNAVLREAQRRGREELRRSLQDGPLAVRFSHPDILVRRWSESFGESRTATLCEWNNCRPALTACVTRSRTSVSEWIEKLHSAGIQGQQHPADPERFVTLPRGIAIHDLPGYDEGLFYVQDPSTRIAPDLLAPRSGENVLDACAAPGGKTSILADGLPEDATLTAADVGEKRLIVLRENLQRMGRERVRILNADISDPDSTRRTLESAGAPDRFDAILLDVPCTNTGVIRRRPDVRWRFSEKRLRHACASQRAILTGAASLLANGGRIVYSTCSLEPEENLGQVEEWLTDNPGFELVESHFVFPPEAGTDGAFAALIRRRS